jgi:DNA polymerase/3'-5' exonuclease PolX
MLTPIEEYPFALLYFTGSKQFNVKMRSFALSKGYSLNEQGITKNKKKVSQQFESEKDIFAFLEYPYVVPHKR